MTKGGSFAGWAGGDHVADLDLTIGDDDTGDQPFDQLSLLLPAGLLHALVHPAAELLHAQPKARDLGLAIPLRFELPALRREGLLALLQLASPTPVFLQPHHARQVSLGEPL